MLKSDNASIIFFQYWLLYPWLRVYDNFHPKVAWHTPCVTIWQVWETKISVIYRSIIFTKKWHNGQILAYNTNKESNQILTNILSCRNRPPLIVYTQGPRTRGVWGGRTPPRIRDLYSKKISKNFSYLLGPPWIKIVPWPLCIRYDNNLLTLGMLEIYINQEIKHIFCHSLQTHPPSFSVMLGRYSTYINPHSLLCTIEFLYSYQLTWATVLGARVAWQLFGGEFRATNLRFPLLCLVILLVIGFRFLQWCCQLMMKYMPP